jgi:hypothetical protein
MVELSPVTFRISSRLNSNLAKAAQKLEMPKNEYVWRSLQRAVAHDLPTPEYQRAWDMLQAFYNSLSPDIDNNGNPDRDMLIASALEIVLPQLRQSE